MKYSTILSQSNYMIVNKKIAKSLGLINSILVSNLCSLEEKYGNGFFFTQEEMAETCCVCLDTIKKGLSFLKKEGYIDIKKKGIPCKNYYYLTEKFDVFLMEIIPNKKTMKIYTLNNKKNYYNRQLKSKEWKNFRKEVFKIKGKKCEICNSTNHLNIHHPFYTKGKLAWEYNPSDMMVLCLDCHKKIHNII